MPPTLRRLVPACALVLWAALCPAAGAQQVSLPHRHALSLEAHSVANGGRSEVTGGSNGLPFANVISVQSAGDRRVSSNQTNVEISVRNLAAAPDRVRVEWFFVALPVSGTPAGVNREVIFHRDAQELAIPGGKTATQVVSSPEVRAVYEHSTTITNIPASQSITGYGSSTVTVTNLQQGLAIRGWMVRLVTLEGAVLAAKGSSQTYEDLASSPGKLSALLTRSGFEEARTPGNAGPATQSPKKD